MKAVREHLWVCRHSSSFDEKVAHQYKTKQILRPPQITPKPQGLVNR